ncbi:hypothetical protein ACMXYO_16625 [Neptuniibacter sp. QD37_6]|uniref:hypothetical protein n=1 Tax=Neptuniibacter sp. QD37_6 TaxID=3398210 RepID=UPI0039F478EE
MRHSSIEAFEQLVIQHHKIKVEAEKESSKLRSSVQATQLTVFICAVLLSIFFERQMSDTAFYTIQFVGAIAFISIFFGDSINLYLSRNSQLSEQELSLFCDVCEEYERLSPELKKEADKIKETWR